MVSTRQQLCRSLNLDKLISSASVCLANLLIIESNGLTTWFLVTVHSCRSLSIKAIISILQEIVVFSERGPGKRLTSMPTFAV
ncbi:hypothetical protein L596_005000 [Steinernema carpocapsae]|uniref:Uncharacterized protein n=1 Tax=Steinernema carpocapsae TaxID=34508 RepID=A0A4U8UXP8_STECR|nr:hypothetical protein L596_005000 [Steinernema carpocapsae]